MNCSQCTYVTKKYFNMQRHIRRRHDTSTTKHPLHRNPNSSRYSKNVEESSKQDPKNCYVCTFCNQGEFSRELLFQHYTVKHNVTYEEKTFQFADLAAFLSWKSNFESETMSRFVKMTGTRNMKNCKMLFYRCHRDGFYKSTGAGRKSMKVKGTNKINTACPAEMMVSVDNVSSEVGVRLVDTHVGHSNDIDRLNLTKEDRQQLADKIAAGIPFSRILDDFRDTVSGDKVERIQLLTKKDLYNIAYRFNISKDVIRSRNDYTNVDSWVDDNVENHLVRFYKPQGVPAPDQPALADDDFVLIMANDSQLHMLKQYGGNVCFDEIHGVEENDFKLTTLMVLDDLRQVYPCAFMMSNKADSVLLELFLIVIKEELGCQLMPSVLLSHPCQMYREAWNDVMSPPKSELLCSWLVETEWRKHILSIECEDKQGEVYNTLSLLLHEKDVKLFPKELEDVLSQLTTDPDTKAFGGYFLEEFGDQPEKWACCFRTDSIINIHTNLENMHSTLESLFEGNKPKKLNKCICELMKFIRDRLFNRIIASDKNKLSKKISDIRRRHRQAMESPNVQIVVKPDRWSVSSGSNPTFYDVVQANLDCDCALRCDECNICLHSFKCSCHESAIKWNLCCHIHLVATNALFLENDVEMVADDNVSISNDLEEIETQYEAPERLLSTEGIIVEVPSQEEREKSLEESKKECADLYLGILEMIENSQSVEEIAVIKGAVQHVQTAIETHRASIDVDCLDQEITSSTVENFSSNHSND